MADYRAIHLHPEDMHLDPCLSGSQSPNDRATERKKIFGFEIFIDSDILQHFGDSEILFNSVREQGKAERIQFNPDLTIPDLQGRNVQIYDRSMETKYQSAKVLLSLVSSEFKRMRSESFSVIIFVPEGMVSLLIGTKGHQINKIMRESRTTIVVNQPINRMTYRTVKIQGHHHDIAKACRIIYEILEDKSPIAYNIEKEPSPLDYTKAKVTTKLILDSHALTFLSNHKKRFLKQAEEHTRCNLRFKDENNRLLKRDEDIITIVGRLEDAQALVVLLLTVINNFYVDERDGEDYVLKMLIPSNYVTKLIGQKGYMIKGITDKSGALIKIQSDKQSELRECIISIVGNRESKIDATCFILEQIECFKNGGPILQSGKSINENLAQQFKNSIPLRPVDLPALQNHQQKEEQPPVPTLVGSQPLIEQGEKVIKSPLIATLETLKMTQQSSVNDNKIEMGEIKKETPPIKRQPSKSSSSNSSSNSDSNSDSCSQSRSRSRDRRRRVNDKPKRDKSESLNRRRKSASSGEKHGSRQKVQVKMVIPRRLSVDHKELRYIEQLSGSEIVFQEQRGDEESMVTIRGVIRDNNQCMRLLMKRLSRYTDKK